MDLFEAWEISANLDALLSRLIVSTLGSLQPRKLRVGVGISPGVTPGHWRVALRAWSREALGREMEREIERLRDAVEVRVTGPILALSGEERVLPNVRRERPLLPGCSIGHYKATVGTLGAFVRGTTGAVQMLSNNHVLAQVNLAMAGDVILQPGVRDGGLLESDEVGRLSAFHPLQPSGNEVDAAVADVDPAVLPQDFALPGIGALQGLRTGVLAGVGPVRKVGRSTGLTHGRITALGLRNLPVQFGQTVLLFDQVVEIEGMELPFSASGDSGALVVDAERRAVGLLFGGSDQSTYINPIETVLSVLSIELL
ncbi:hypothetical protein [Melittangium boletus]|uniref:Nal1 C-terminal domain-containing protein n=1 Tax=Melittangium boletus DSM 14713 TaxID=1294270 RepID=A0A250IP90_9BACT|nr:hypothetical protein [Melittangium boletus]ATB33559.1 hypothetical protein MEBOL_007057 [Melittangium boletus DSM 14713]